MERSQIAFARMREAVPRFDKLVDELMSLSEEVEHCVGISEEAREQVRQFYPDPARSTPNFKSISTFRARETAWKRCASLA